MAHFAKIDKTGLVLEITVVHNDVATTEAAGEAFLNKTFNTPNDDWKQTSYNTAGGIHRLGGTPFRKNYAQLGGKYDSARDAFIPPQEYQSWVLNDETCLWDPPTPYPDDGKTYFYDDMQEKWVLKE